jgi:uncharacterized phage infection (PIP) family protein YhgE
MKVTEINVSAGRVVSHPIEQYSNLKPMVSLKAVLDEGDDYEQSVKDLQAKAEGLVEDHANTLKKHIRDMYYLSEREREAKRIEDQIVASQKRLEEIRSEIPLLSSGELDTETDEEEADRETDW